MRRRISCPAKINTFLSVGPPDAKGWHPLRTIFQAIDLRDTIEIEEAEEDFIGSDVDWMPAVNTVSTALELLRSRCDFPKQRVFLTKRIHPESGLGGGSSDAAGLLRALQARYPEAISEEQIRAVAEAVGADVPFFLIGGRAAAEGYGEQLRPLPDEPERRLVVARPRFGCSTPEMFGKLDSIKRKWREFPEGDRIYNDFLSVAPSECADMVDALIDAGADGAGLSGSGSAVFGFFECESTAANAARELREAFFCDVWETRTLSRAESLEQAASFQSLDA